MSGTLSPYPAILLVVQTDGEGTNKRCSGLQTRLRLSVPPVYFQEDCATACVHNCGNGPRRPRRTLEPEVAAGALPSYGIMDIPRPAGTESERGSYLELAVRVRPSSPLFPRGRRRLRYEGYRRGCGGDAMGLVSLPTWRDGNAAADYHFHNKCGCDS